MRLADKGSCLLEFWNETYEDKVYNEPIRHLQVLILEHLDSEGPDYKDGTHEYVVGGGEWWPHDLDVNVAFDIAWDDLVFVGAME